MPWLAANDDMITSRGGAAKRLTSCLDGAGLRLLLLQLCNEDYHWWWRSFISSGACAFYTMLYSVWYNLTELNLTGFVSQFVYFGYMSLICFTFFLVTGTIGFVSCFWFNLKIYGSIKVD